jgi:hypothetical protein
MKLRLCMRCEPTPKQWWETFGIGDTTKPIFITEVWKNEEIKLGAPICFLFDVTKHRKKKKGVRKTKRLLRTFTSTEPFLSPDDIVMIGIGPVPTLNYQGGPIELLKVRPI